MPFNKQSLRFYVEQNDNENNYFDIESESHESTYCTASEAILVGVQRQKAAAQTPQQHFYIKLLFFSFILFCSKILPALCRI